jgi:hypothetical protein
MSLVTKLQDGFTRVGTEFKSIRTLIGGTATADISGLTTTDKSSIVAAINEVKAGATGSPPSASETTAGVAELATQTETNTGTDDARIVTPLKFHTRLLAYAQPLHANLTTLAGVASGTFGRTLLEAANQAAALTSLGIGAASETVSGLIEIATQTEVNTGTDDVRAVTPLKLQTRLAAYAQPLDADLTALAAAGNSGVLAATTASFLTAQATKLGHISVTQAVDLDAIETRVAALDAAVWLAGTWDASAGTFPGGGTAQAGALYIVSVAGTVNGVSFAVGDRIVAIADNASTTTYASNWFKEDYTDAVLSVDGQTGAVSIVTQVITNGVTNRAPSEDAVFDALALKANAADVYTKTEIGDPTTDFAAGFVAALT